MAKKKININKINIIIMWAIETMLEMNCQPLPDLSGSASTFEFIDDLVDFVAHLAFHISL